jgi:hypothetical protein
MVNYRGMTGDQLRQRIDWLGLTYREAADLLGLGYGGLHHQMRGERAVTRQTEIILERLEADCAAQVAAHVPRGRRRSARCDA